MGKKTRLLMIALFVVVNVLIAGPLQAGLTDDICWGDLGAMPCCTFCVLLCECTV